MKITHRIQLPSLMKFLNLPMIAIELGSAEGYSAKDFMEQGVEYLHMVDLWQTIEGQKGDGGNPQSFHDKNYYDTMKRMKRFEGMVKVHRGLTKDMASEIEDNIAGLVYIDAAHDFDNVWSDINSYWSKLVSGGIMAFHDYENTAYGVKEAVTKFAIMHNYEIHLLPENKKEDAGAYLIKK